MKPSRENLRQDRDRSTMNTASDNLDKHAADVRFDQCLPATPGVSDARTILETGSAQPLTVLLRSPHAQFFRHEAGAVGFFRHGRGILSVGGALAAPHQREQVLQAFVQWAEAQGHRPYFMHALETDLPILARMGFRMDQLGASYSLFYDSTKLEGSIYRQVRRKLNAAQRAGVTVEHIADRARFEVVKPQLADINRQWLKAKRHGHLRYLVSHFDHIRLDEDERLYVAWHGGEAIAYVLFSRTFGCDAGWFHNLSRRRTQCVDGTMQMIVAELMRETAPSNLHLGFTPMVELKPSELPGSPPLARIVAALARRGGVVYPARAQRQYKISWAPQTITPEYFAYKGNSLMASLWLLRATNSI